MIRRENANTLILVLLGAFSSSAIAGHVGELTTFTAGTPAVATEVNGNFSALTTAVNDNASQITANGALITEHTGAIDALQSGLKAAQNDLTKKQATIVGSCLVGSAIREIDADGNVVCENDDLPNGSTSISAFSMQASSDGLCDVRKTYLSGYAWFHTTSTSSTCTMSTGVQLPDQATITSLGCRIMDNDGTGSSPIVQLYRAPNNGTAPEIMYQTTVVSDANSVQSVSDLTNAVPGPVDNANYNYFLIFRSNGVDTQTAGTNLRFYNCHIDYAYDLLY